MLCDFTFFLHIIYTVAYMVTFTIFVLVFDIVLIDNIRQNVK